jgi:hypothetical protein
MYTRLEREGKDKEKDRSLSCPLERIVIGRMKAFEGEGKGKSTSK